MDEPRPGARRSITDTRVKAVVTQTLESVQENATRSNAGQEEKRQVQALNRTQPILTLSRGVTGQARDYKRHGVTAPEALDVDQRSDDQYFYRRNRHREFLSLLILIYIHRVMDSYGTHEVLTTLPGTTLANLSPSGSRSLHATNVSRWHNLGERLFAEIPSVG